MPDFIALTPTPESEYTRNADGYYVGTDGFVVPRNFAEFQERYPLYIRDWVRKRMFGKMDASEVELLTAQLTLHMMTLPEISMFRDMGFTDRVQAFNPNKGHVRGATGLRFFHYLKNCFNNFYLTVHQKKTSDPVSWQHTPEFENFVEKHNPELVPSLQLMCVDDRTYQDARLDSGLSVQMFDRARSRLKVLRQCFANGLTVPRRAA